jgi:hypothetical protein
MEKTHWKKAFNKDYLGSHDLDEGKDLSVVIDRIEVRKVKNNQGEEASKNIAILKGQYKPMILNVTNCKTIKKFSGSNYIEDWNDIPIIIYVARVNAFGEEVEALRIRDRQPVITKPKLTPDHEKWPAAIDYLKKDGNSMSGILNGWDVSPEDQTKLQEGAI